MTVWRSEVALNEHGGSDIVYTFGFDDTGPANSASSQDGLDHHELAITTTGCAALYGGDNITTSIRTLSQGGVDIPHDAEAEFVRQVRAVVVLCMLCMLCSWCTL